MVETSPRKKYTAKIDFEFHRSLLNKTHYIYIYMLLPRLQHIYICSASYSFYCLQFFMFLQIGSSFLILKTLKLCAVAEGVRQDNIFIEVIWMSIAVTLDLIDDLMNRNNWCLLSISMGQFWRGLVHRNIVCKKWHKTLGCKKSWWHA